MATWFGYFAPTVLLRQATISPAFRVHLACSGCTTLACVWNLWRTPSVGPLARRVHRVLGRVASVTSIVGTVCGYIAAWTDEGVPRGTAIGLSIVGVLQFFYTIKGMRAIRQAKYATGISKKQLIERHQEAMIELFYGCCLGSAWFRLPGWLGLVKVGSAPLWAQALGIVPPFFIIPLALRAHRSHSFF